MEEQSRTTPTPRFEAIRCLLLVPTLYCSVLSQAIRCQRSVVSGPAWRRSPSSKCRLHSGTFLQWLRTFLAVFSIGSGQIIRVSCGVIAAGCVYGGFERGGDPVDFVTGGSSGTAGSMMHASGSAGAAGREAAEQGTAGIAGHIATGIVPAGSLGAAGERSGSEALGSGLVSATGTVLETGAAGSAGFGGASAGALGMGAAGRAGLL